MNIYSRLQKSIVSYYKSELIILRKRLESLVNESFRGFELSRGIPCYLTTDERTISPEGNYYGCYINYRENGPIIGNIMEDDTLIQDEKLYKYAIEAKESLICSKFCAEITSICNQYIYEKLCEHCKVNMSKKRS